MKEIDDRAQATRAEPDKATIRMSRDLLVESAPLAYAAAKRSCRVDPATGESCAWYHGTWQYLCLLETMSTPGIHREWMALALRSLAGTGDHSRVLISGSADHGLLDMVNAAFRAEHAILEAGIVDICRTPLFLNEWFAEKMGIRISTWQTDVLEFEAPGSFDLICTHGFLGYFDGPGRKKLVSHWHGLLRPGGKLVLVQRIRDGHPASRTGFDPEQANAFKDRVFRQAARYPERVDLSPRKLGELAEDYARRFRCHVIRSRSELYRLFAGGVFRLVTFDALHSGKAGEERISGPSIPGRARFAGIVAMRE